LTHDSVEAVVVVGVKHKTDGQLPRAYVKKRSEVTEEELIKFVEGFELTKIKSCFNLIVINYILLQKIWDFRNDFEVVSDLLM